MRKALAVKSSFVSLFAKIVTMIFSLIIARYFMRYLGVENSGINGVFSNVIGFLQLAELGIGTAIVYALYEPLVEGNDREVGILMRFYRKVYRYIGGIILVFGIILCPFVTFFIHDATYSKTYLIITFLLQIISSASTYFLSYKRNLLYADQKQYIAAAIDALVNIISAIIRLYVMVYTGSYIIYLGVQVVQNIVSNLIISLWCDRQYPFLKNLPTDKYDKMPQLIDNVKNLMVGKIGGWVYKSTDNLIISRFTTVILVGLLANYYTLSITLKTLINAMVEPIQPMIGHMVCEDRERSEVYDFFLSYTFIRYCIAIMATVGFIEMANPIVSIWLGPEYVVNQSIVILMAIDIFISVSHGPTVEFIATLGLFKNDKNLSIAGAVINLSSSLILVQFMGAEGVLLGTVIAQCFYWSIRAVVVFRQYFHMGWVKYIFKCVKYIISTVASVIVLNYVFYSSYFATDSLLVVIIRGIITAAVSGMVIIIFNAFTDEFRYLLNMIYNSLRKKYR